MSCIRLTSTSQRMTIGRKKITRPKKLSSTFDVPATSSFAAMDVSNQFKQVFEVMDANGDGRISPVDLREVLSCLGYKKADAVQEAGGILREMDCNGDGFIDLEEFLKAVSVGRPRNDEESKIFGCGNHDGEEDDCDLMEAFLIFDTDKNGKISAKKLQRVLVSLGSQKCSLKERRQMIKGVDKNGDGVVDFEEFKLMMTRSYGS